ncbi:hypothetical protein KAH81_10395 [bacterium]|nr:hypothetical protein [bacterium]
MSKKNIKMQDVEWEMRRFLESDPIPRLGESEISRLTEKVINGEKLPRRLTWWDIRPIFKGAFGVAVVLIAVFVTAIINNGSSNIEVAESRYSNSFFEEYGAEEVLVEAIYSGDLDFEFAAEKLIDETSRDLESSYEGYYDTDYISDIEELNDDEAQKILKLMDELGYPDREA